MIVKKVLAKDYAKHYLLHRVLKEHIWIGESLESMVSVYGQFDNTYFLYSNEEVLLGGAVIEPNWCGFVFETEKAEESFILKLHEILVNMSDSSKELCFFAMSKHHQQQLEAIGYITYDGEMSMMASSQKFEVSPLKHYSLRTLNDHDSEALIKLYTKTYQAHPSPWINYRTEKHFTNLIKEQMDSFDRTYSILIEDQNKKLCACAMIEIWQGGPFILDFIVDPDVQNQGLGTNMIEKILNMAYQDNYPYVRLNVTPNNRVINLYKRYGFIAFTAVYHLKKELLLQGQQN